MAQTLPSTHAMVEAVAGTAKAEAVKNKTVLVMVLVNIIEGWNCHGYASGKALF